MKNLPTGTVTFLFTDIEGSTALLQRLGDRRYAAVLDEHRRLLRVAFAEGNGQEVDTQGDAFLVAFPRARDAVAAAVAAQRALTNHAWPDGESLRVRMGLHTGEPVSGTGDYTGLDVHRAARICAAGHGGQILLSDAVSGLAARDLPPGVSLRDLGIHHLKDLREPEHLFQVAHPDLPADYPPVRSLDARPKVEQQIRFCRARDGARIAYTTLGSGPPIVKASNWITHLEFDLRSPVWQHWWERLSAGRCLVRYDERGSGLSDWNVEDLSFEATVGDLETVVNALGIERFPLLGISQGGPIAAAFAARHPDRVTHLITYGTYARGRAKRGAEAVEEFETQMALTRHGWGKDDPAYRQVFTTQFMPDATREQQRWFNDLQRASASAENAVRLQRMMAQIDVTSILPALTVPTLVLHCRDDARVPFNAGREFAALTPGARFVPLEGRNHLPQPDDPCWEPLIAEIRSFLGEPALPSTTAS